MKGHQGGRLAATRRWDALRQWLGQLEAAADRLNHVQLDALPAGNTEGSSLRTRSPSRKQAAQGFGDLKSRRRGATDLQRENGVWVVHRLDQLGDVAEIREGRCLGHLDDPGNHGLHGRDIA